MCYLQNYLSLYIFVTALYSTNCSSHRDHDNDSGEVRVYPGKLQVSEAYCIIPVNAETTIDDLIRESVMHFGLENSKVDDYRLSQILLDRGGKTLWFT